MTGFAEEFMKAVDEANANIPAKQRFAVLMVTSVVSIGAAVGTTREIIKIGLQTRKAMKSTV